MLSNLVVEYEKVSDPRLPACSRANGHLLETCTTIMDLSGASLWSAKDTYTYMQKVSAVSQNYYPERLGKLYVINAPMGFSTVFGWVKGFLDPVTVSKIHVLGSGYQKELLAQVHPSNLPKQFGGNCDCPGGCEHSDAGPWQDPRYTRTPEWAKKAGIKDGLATNGQNGDVLKDEPQREDNVQTNGGANGVGTNGDKNEQNGASKQDPNGTAIKEENGVAAKVTEANLDEGTKTKAKGGIDQRVG